MLGTLLSEEAITIRPVRDRERESDDADQTKTEIKRRFFLLKKKQRQDNLCLFLFILEDKCVSCAKSWLADLTISHYLVKSVIITV